ncbi:3-dehydroquinate dehydratase [Methanosarcinales archaeon]|nr:MAG: 3-dehydroquinate dehydratase [Methanosarcinales archaeon]
MGFPTIITCRKKEEGGEFEGGEVDRKKIMMDILDRADMIDVELSSIWIDEVVERAREIGTRTIVSYHNFVETPALDEMMDIFKKELEKGDVGKIAVMPRNKEDTLTTLHAVCTASHMGSVCAISMGEIGAPTRIIAPLYGSVLTYGSLGKGTAPGQYSVRTLREGLKILGLKSI